MINKQYEHWNNIYTTFKIYWSYCAIILKRFKENWNYLLLIQDYKMIIKI